MTGYPDEFNVDGLMVNSSMTELDPLSNKHGDWYFDESSNITTFIGKTIEDRGLNINRRTHLPKHEKIKKY